MSSKLAMPVDAAGLQPSLNPVPVSRLREFGLTPLRDDAQLMRPEVLGSLQPSALSCSRYFVERMFDSVWRIECTKFAIDEDGAGIARYSIHADDHHFEFVVLANAPVEGGRSGRVLDGERDMNASLYEGLATDSQIQAMRREMPKIYSGRAEGDTLIWCRGNRSMRIFEHVVERLAEGRQPDPISIAETGYLIRNVGIEGNGIYGTRSFADYGSAHPLSYPYMAQMLAGYLMREFSFDLAEHLAKIRSTRAVTLHQDFKRFIGIGNGSAIGLVFFVYNRPQFIGRWLEMRERLLAAATALQLDKADPRRALLSTLLRRASNYFAEDEVSELTAARRADRSTRLAQLADRIEKEPAVLLDLSKVVEELPANSASDVTEIFYSCLMELLPDLRNEMLDCFVVDEELPLSPDLSLSEIATLIEADYQWSLAIDTESPDANHFVWYQSASNDEPRRGTRHDTPASLNMIRNIAAGVKALHADIDAFGRQDSLAAFLLAYPHHRYLVQRLALLREARFHTPHCNPFSKDFVALSLVRLVMVGFYGLEKPVDFLDRNSRGIMFHGAPARNELGSHLEPGWFYPPLPKAGQ